MDNTNLITLAIENTLLYPSFDTNVVQYEAEVSREITDLNLLAIPEDDQAIVNVTGVKNLQEGINTVNIEVIASDGITKREYVINVKRRNLEEEDNYLKEQEKNKEKLEKIYKTLEEKELLYRIDEVKNYEATRTNIENNIDKKNTNNWYIIGIVAILVILGFTIIKLNSKKCNKDRNLRT